MFVHLAMCGCRSGVPQKSKLYVSFAFLMGIKPENFSSEILPEVHLSYCSLSSCTNWWMHRASAVPMFPMLVWTEAVRS